MIAQTPTPQIEDNLHMTQFQNKNGGLVQGVIKNRKTKERTKNKKNTVSLHKIQLIYNHFDICYDKKKDNRV